MELLMKVSSSTVKCTEKESLYGLIVGFTKENFLITKYKV